MMVSCIIPTYNQFAFLYETIDSIIMQDYDSIEIIITDDCSDNFSDQKILNYINNKKGKNIVSINILKHENNVGTVKNMNDAIDKCLGEIIIPIASDDVLYNTKVITKIVNRFIESKCSVLVCSRMKCSNDLEEKIRLMPHPAYLKFIRNKLNTPKKIYVAFAMGNSLEFASGAALYYRADFIKERGGYDEKYDLWEDGPFLTQLSYDGIQIEKAYDIISIYYREGGISSHKHKIPSRIEKDYCNFFQWEFLDKKNSLTFRQYRIVKGRKYLQEKYNKITLKFVFCYPTAFFNLLINRSKKAWLRFCNLLKRKR